MYWFLQPMTMKTKRQSQTAVYTRFNSPTQIMPECFCNLLICLYIHLYGIMCSYMKNSTEVRKMVQIMESWNYKWLCTVRHKSFELNSEPLKEKKCLWLSRLLSNPEDKIVDFDLILLTRAICVISRDLQYFKEFLVIFFPQN